MHPGDCEVIHFKGNLIFGEEPDWEMMAKGIAFYSQANRHDHHPLEFGHAVIGERLAFLAAAPSRVQESRQSTDPF